MFKGFISPSMYGNHIFFSMSTILFGESIEEGTASYYHTIKAKNINMGTGPIADPIGSTPDTVVLLGLPCPPEWKVTPSLAD